MKTLCRWTLLAGWLLVCTSGGARADDEKTRLADAPEIEAAYQMVFLSVLDGCFQDGLTNEDVDQILWQAGPDKFYAHFIYACPICEATAHALEAYRAGPSFTERKVGGKVKFGRGLTPGMHARLYSSDPKERLAIIHDLEENWVSRRVSALRLNGEESARVQRQFKLARDEGIRQMQVYTSQERLEQMGSAYRVGDECALCNAAAGMKLKLASEPAR